MQNLKKESIREHAYSMRVERRRETREGTALVSAKRLETSGEKFYWKFMKKFLDAECCSRAEQWLDPVGMQQLRCLRCSQSQTEPQKRSVFVPNIVFWGILIRIRAPGHLTGFRVL
ncbi:hypothetical protein KQX54_003348 [Cotesia glomerata]|uniref:Uncharacterized protein n=1 Tax=Cotesia glomerata TaxID=32391 RepID=A0AAV7IM28_COTGL|nr:hypothetical protein KQX54_003348 [Cotesia glomerata]